MRGGDRRLVCIKPSVHGVPTHTTLRQRQRNNTLQNKLQQSTRLACGVNNDWICAHKEIWQGEGSLVQLSSSTEVCKPELSHQLRHSVLHCVPKIAASLFQTRPIQFVVHGFQLNIVHCTVLALLTVKPIMMYALYRVCSVYCHYDVTVCLHWDTFNVLLLTKAAAYPL